MVDELKKKFEQDKLKDSNREPHKLSVVLETDDEQR